MKYSTILLSFLFIQTSILFGQERVTDFQNLAGTSTEYRHVSVHLQDSISFLIEKSSSKIRVSEINNNIVSELYVLGDFPENQGSGTVLSFNSPINPHFVHDGFLYEYFKDQIRKRELVTGTITDTWIFAEIDLSHILEIEAYGDFCFLRYLGGRFAYLNINSGELTFLDYNENEIITHSGHVFYVDEAILYMFDPISGQEVVHSEYPSYYGLPSLNWGRRYVGADGEDKLVISNWGDFSDEKVFDGNETTSYPPIPESSNIIGIFGEGQFIAVALDDFGDKYLKVYDLSTMEELFSQEFSFEPELIGIDKKYLDERHYLIQFKSFSASSYLFDSFTGEISQIPFSNLKSFILRNSIIKKDSALYLIAKNTSENFEPDGIDLGIDAIKIDSEDLSITYINNAFDQFQHGMASAVNANPIIITRDANSFFLNEFEEEDDINTFHQTTGYTNIGYDDIQYLDKWNDIILCKTENEIQLISDEIMTNIEGDVSSAHVNSGIANGIIVQDNISSFFTLNMENGDIDLQELDSQYIVGQTYHTGTAIFGDFSINHSLYFDAIQEQFIDIPLSDSIQKIYQSNDQILLQTKNVSANELHIFNQNNILTIDQQFGSDLFVVARSNGAFIIIEKLGLSNTLYYINKLGTITASVTIEGDRIMSTDQYLIAGNLSVLLFNNGNRLHTILSMNESFQAFEYESIGSSQITKIKYTKVEDGIVLKSKSTDEINFLRWNSQSIELNLPLNESIVATHVTSDNIKLVTNFDLDYYLNIIDRNTGEIIEREEQNTVDYNNYPNDQNRIYRINESQQYIIDQTGFEPSNFHTGYIDFLDFKIRPLHDQIGGEELKQASDFIYTDNYIYCKAIVSSFPDNFQLFRIPTNGVTSTKDTQNKKTYRLAIVPNIAQESIQLNIQLFDVHIVNKDGIEISNLGDQSPFANINISGLDGGLYYLYGYSKDGSIETSQFIKF